MARKLRGNATANRDLSYYQKLAADELAADERGLTRIRSRRGTASQLKNVLQLYRFKLFQIRVIRVNPRLISYEYLR